RPSTCRRRNRPTSNPFPPEVRGWSGWVRGQKSSRRFRESCAGPRRASGTGPAVGWSSGARGRPAPRAWSQAASRSAKGSPEGSGSSESMELLHLIPPTLDGAGPQLAYRGLRAAQESGYLVERAALPVVQQNDAAVVLRQAFEGPGQGLRFLPLLGRAAR